MRAHALLFCFRRQLVVVAVVVVVVVFVVVVDLLTFVTSEAVVDVAFV